LIGAKKLILGAQKWLENDFDEPTALNIFHESNFFLKNVLHNRDEFVQIRRSGS